MTEAIVETASKPKSMAVRWIAWFALMPIPVPFFNLLTYFFLLVLTPLSMIPAYHSDPLFKISHYGDWRYWVASFVIAAYNFWLLLFIINKHERDKAEGKTTGAVITWGAAALMLLGLAAFYCAMKSTVAPAS